MGAHGLASPNLCQIVGLTPGSIVVETPALSSSIQPLNLVVAPDGTLSVLVGTGNGGFTFAAFLPGS
jgi:hypothetical protein